MKLVWYLFTKHCAQLYLGTDYVLITEVYAADKANLENIREIPTRRIAIILETFIIVT